MQFIDLASQYRMHQEKIDSQIKNVLEHGRYIMGPEVDEFENKLAEYLSVKHVVSCANGTDALVLALMALGVKQGDTVICPTFTFYATAEAIAFLGATPVFVDSERQTYNLCPKSLEEQIEKAISDPEVNLKAIITVDLFGLPANYPAIREIADKYKLPIVEDAAQGLGGQIGSKMAGTFGDIGTTSFFPAKPLGCYGDGGAVITDSDEVAEIIKSLRVHGQGENKYHNIRVGMNSRLDTIQAAILLEKLRIFPEEVELRNGVADYYKNKYGELYQLPRVPEGFISSWAQYTLVASSRNDVAEQFAKEGIPTMIYYKTCLHLQPVFETLGYKRGDFPVAEYLSDHVLSLPMHPYLVVE